MAKKCSLVHIQVNTKHPSPKDVAVISEMLKNFIADDKLGKAPVQGLGVKKTQMKGTLYFCSYSEISKYTGEIEAVLGDYAPSNWKSFKLIVVDKTNLLIDIWTY